MAHGDPFLSPWVSDFPDYQQRKIKITVNFNDSTRAIINAVVHRDAGCLWHTVVFDVPSSGQSKRLTAPADGAGDRTYTSAQIAAQGLSTIDQAMALQITAEA